MSGPVEFARQLQTVEALLKATPDWGGLEQGFAPAAVSDNFDPGDDMKQVLSAFYNTDQGRKIIEWLFDLTLRAPFPHVGTTLEAAGIAAAKHEARVAVGQALARAIVDGNSIFTSKRSQSHEKPA